MWQWIGKLMARVVIGSMILGTQASGTGRGYQRHLVYASAVAAQWVFLYSSSSNNTGISTYYASGGTIDTPTWTAGTASSALSSSYTLGSDDKNFGTYYKNISTNDIVHVGLAGVLSTTNVRRSHARLVLTSNTQTWGAWNDGTAQTQNSSQLPAGINTVIDSNNKIIDIHTVGSSGGDPNAQRYPNADAGTSWTVGSPTGTDIDTTVANFTKSCCLLDTGSGTLMALYDDGNAANEPSMKNVLCKTFNGASWSSGSGVAGIGVLSSALAVAVDENNWGTVARTTGDIHVVVVDTNGNFTHRRSTGSTTFSAGDTISTSGLTGYKQGSGVFLCSDGTSVWLYIIDTDANQTVRRNKWVSGTGWSGWSTVDATSRIRNYISGFPSTVSGVNGVVWTETNGTHFDAVFYGDVVSTSVVWVPDVQAPFINPVNVYLPTE